MVDGPRIVLTRERERNRSWADELAGAGLRVLELPLVRFEPLPAAGDCDAAAFDWILFTSPQGVKAFADAGLEPGRARMAALGEGTAAALAAAGWTDALGLTTRDGVEFVQAFMAVVAEPGRVLLPGPRRRMSEPRASLTTAGCEVRELALYETLPVPATELPSDPFAPGDIVFFCSPSTVRAFTGMWTERPRCVAIGASTADAARAAGFPTEVAATPDLDAMVRAAGLEPHPTTAKPEIES
jgi:uroporphyrinogen-III synthase